MLLWTSLLAPTILGNPALRREDVAKFDGAIASADGRKPPEGAAVGSSLLSTSSRPCCTGVQTAACQPCCSESLTLLIESDVENILDVTKSWVIADRMCRSNVEGALCDPCAVGSLSKPLPLRYDSIYCEDPDDKKDYVICFDATPRTERLVCKPGWGWDPIYKVACDNPLRKCAAGEDVSPECGGRCKLTGGWVKQAGARPSWPACPQSALNYQSAHDFGEELDSVVSYGVNGTDNQTSI